MSIKKVQHGAMYMGYLLTGSRFFFERLKPISILWAITWDCQKKCSYCNREDALSSQKPLDLETVSRMISDFKKIGVPTVSMTGGEILLYKNLSDVLQLLKKYKILVNLNTNGLLLPDFWDKYKHYVYSYTVGLNALTDKEKKQLLDFLEKVVPNRKRPRINLRLVLSSKNYKDIFESYQYYKKFSDKILFQPLHPKMSEIDFHEANENLLMKDDIIDIKRLMKEKKIKSRTLQKYIMYNLYNRPVECYAGIFTLTIDPYGNIYNCNHLKEKIGQVSQDKSFFEIYQDLKSYRNKIYSRNETECQCFTNDRRIDWLLSRLVSARKDFFI